MNGNAERQSWFDELELLERSMTTLLDALESPSSTAESIGWAVSSYDAIRFDPAPFAAAFQKAPADELARARSRLSRLVDLEALLRDECVRALTRTSRAIEQVRVVRAQLDALAPTEETGTSLDCVR